MACYTPLKGYKDPITNGLVFYKTSTPLKVACGQCIGCRIDRTLMWAMRIVHEAQLHQDDCGNCFVTLTYRDRSAATEKQIKDGHYIPADLSLNKTHFQKFIKRLRRHFPQKIKYFHCGEYGDETLRPHYHACLFNCGFPDQQIFKSDQGITTYCSPTLEKLWPYGFGTIGELNFATASYTAGYILKKITGKAAADAYLRSDADGVAYWVQPPYLTMSLGHKKPGGIGAAFYEKFKGDFFPSDTSPVPGKGVIPKVPRYYETILKSESPDVHQLVKEMRETWARAHAHELTDERLKEKHKHARIIQSELKRDKL